MFRVFDHPWSQCLYPIFVRYKIALCCWACSLWHNNACSFIFWRLLFLILKNVLLCSEGLLFCILKGAFFILEGLLFLFWKGVFFIFKKCSFYSEGCFLSFERLLFLFWKVTFLLCHIDKVRYVLRSFTYVLQPRTNGVDAPHQWSWW